MASRDSSGLPGGSADEGQGGEGERQAQDLNMEKISLPSARSPSLPEVLGVACTSATSQCLSCGKLSGVPPFLSQGKGWVLVLSAIKLCTVLSTAEYREEAQTREYTKHGKGIHLDQNATHCSLHFFSKLFLLCSLNPREGGGPRHDLKPAGDNFE